MCICINCKYVKDCSMYNLIEKQHHQTVLLSKTIFIPYSSIININIINTNPTKLDWDLVECISFIESPGKWLHNKNT